MYAEMADLERRHWWFQGRRAIVLDVLKRASQRGRVLDIGLGTGYNAKVLLEKGYSVDGVEPASEGLAFARKIAPGAHIIQAPFPSDQIPAATYDVAIMTDVLEHLEDDAAAARELVRVLKPGGKALLTVPALPFLWTPHDERAHHFRRYTKAELQSVLSNAGLTVEFLSYYNFFLFPLIASARLLGAVLPKSNKSDFDKTPKLLNGVLAALFSAEKYPLRWIRFPVGVSLIALVRKPL